MESSTGVPLGTAGEGASARCCTINGRGTLTWQDVRARECAHTRVYVCVCVSAHILPGWLGNGTYEAGLDKSCRAGAAS